MENRKSIQLPDSVMEKERLSEIPSPSVVKKFSIQENDVKIFYKEKEFNLVGKYLEIELLNLAKIKKLYPDVFFSPRGGESIKFKYKSQGMKGNIALLNIENEKSSIAHCYLSNVETIDKIPQKGGLRFWIPSNQFLLLSAASDTKIADLNKGVLMWRERGWRISPCSCPHYIPNNKSGSPTNVLGTCLEVNYESARELTILCCHATELCVIFGLICGELVAWQSCWIDENTLYKCSDLASFASTTKRPIIIPNSFGRRDWEGTERLGPGVTLIPLGFVEQIFKEFTKDTDWWRKVMHWIVQAESVDSIELSAVCKFIVIDIVYRKVFEEITEYKTDKWNRRVKKWKKKHKNKKVQDPITTKLCKIEENATKDEEAFIELWKSLLSRPYYNSVISSYLKYGGMTENQKDLEKLFHKRNMLLHAGDLKFPREDGRFVICADEYRKVLEFDEDLTKRCLAGLLALLGYGGNFQTRTRSYKVSEELPNWENMSISKLAECKKRIMEKYNLVVKGDGVWQGNGSENI